MEFNCESLSQFLDIDFSVDDFPSLPAESVTDTHQPNVHTEENCTHTNKKQKTNDFYEPQHRPLRPLRPLLPSNAASIDSCIPPYASTTSTNTNSKRKNSKSKFDFFHNTFSGKEFYPGVHRRVKTKPNKAPLYGIPLGAGVESLKSQKFMSPAFVALSRADIPNVGFSDANVRNQLESTFRNNNANELEDEFLPWVRVLVPVNAVRIPGI